MGTNAIGTALIVRQPVQVYSAEHYVRTHHAWTCAAARVHDPKDGRLLGVIDVSGPAATVHPSTLALVDAVAKLAEAQLRAAHHVELERLRAVATPMLARMRGPVLVTDPHGWVAAVAGLPPVNRVLVPERVRGGETWLPAMGPCTAEPLPGGWAPELAEDLFGDAGRTVTVRAEMSRLRRHLGSVLEHRPYRFSDRVEVRVHRPAHPGDLLPGSTAPAVLHWRAAVS